MSKPIAKVNNSVIFCRGHPSPISNLLSEEVLLFLRRYFACATISYGLLDKVIEFSSISSQQEILGDILGRTSFRARKLHRNALKYIIRQLEAQNVEVAPNLYSCFIDPKIGNTPCVDRYYFDQHFLKYILIQEDQCQLSKGTTGLSCWQASCDLANYLLKFGGDIIFGKDVLELGAGCGLVGIAVAISGCAKTITLSDGNNDVLGMIYANLEANSLKNCDNIFTTILQWEAINVSNIPVIPSVIITADVVYDLEAIKPLVCAIKKLLVASEKEGNLEPCCILANTLRSADTMDKFVAYSGESGLLIKNYFTYEDGIFIFGDIKLEDQSLFPFTSNIHCPTVFYELALK
ncbi:unnamed protein product [Thelazia callipaeda]|uniref:FAM86 domain-containing protein n=1 Tax=Thelazia callipaeda TaxID=103827 RepID=A0A158RAW1_THECL|nr:unnamed protein product [Thelazia callipaeda]